MEFLIGRSLENNLTNLLLSGLGRRAAEEKKLEWLELIGQEPDAGLGNGGAFLGALLGRGPGGFGAGLGLGQHVGARLGGGIQTVGEFFVVLAGHGFCCVVS
jgi:hypothetical protein